MASNAVLKDNQNLNEGLGSFALSEADAKSYLAENDNDAFGGIADLGAIRDRMAKAGRFDDDRVGHLATGELVVPKPLLEKLPELRESILGHLREMGVEDPERYIVGNELNSVNPETGMAEYGFGSFFKSVGRAFKSVAKVVKKFAPMIIGAALMVAMPAMAPWVAGMISGGIGTLIQGGSIKQALMSAAIGGVTGSLGGPDGLLGDIGAQALGGAARAAVAGGDMKDILKGGAIGAAGAGIGMAAKANFPETLGSLSISGKAPTTKGLSTMDLIKQDLGFSSPAISTSVTAAMPPPAPASAPPPAPLSAPVARGPFGGPIDTSSSGLGTTSVPPTAPDFIPPLDLIPTADLARINAYTPPNMLQRTLGDNMVTRTVSDTGLSRALQDPVQAFTGAKEITGADLVSGNAPHVPADLKARFNAAKAGAPETSHLNLANQMAANASPSFTSRNPLLVAGSVLAGGVGLGYMAGEDPPEDDKPGILADNFSKGATPEQIAEQRLTRINPNALRGVTPQNRQTLIAGGIGSAGRSSAELRQRFPGLFPEEFNRNPSLAAEGGHVYPRRTGGIMPDEGVPGKDSVRALVMPGEFIYTVDAVKGASRNGDLREGINNMYGVMRGLEARGRRMA